MSKEVFMSTSYQIHPDETRNLHDQLVKPTCMWMGGGTWTDCGHPATHQHTTSLKYCAKHAATMMKYFTMTPINPVK